MCGIIGFTGSEDATTVLLQGLRLLEYRGYDSWGVATLADSSINVMKRDGKISETSPTEKPPRTAKTGIAHTRWATHGAPNQANAHPHCDASGRIAVVHNGIIENASLLRQKLQEQGVHFQSETDTEVIPHLLAQHYDGHPLEALQQVTEKIIGSFAIAVIFSDHADKIFGARRGSPLAVGVGDEEMFLVSDPNAIVKHTRKVVFLEDDEVVEIGKRNFHIERSDRSTVTRETTEIPYGTDALELSGHKTYMEKEIHEQPESLLNGFRGRLLLDDAGVRLEEMNISDSALRQIKNIKIIACGTSWHAGLLGKYLIEEMGRIPVEVDYAAEFRYRNPVIPDDCLVIAISQSGETADTLAAVREARMRGATVCSICNVVGSSLARESDHVIYLHAGPEIGVASTKAFTSQVLVLTLLAIKLGRMKNLGRHKALQLLGMIKSLPSLVERSLRQDKNIREIADKVHRQPNFLFTGRRYQFPVALEGALKLKEISYIHAEGLQAAELKHGPIALVDEEMPVVVIGTECDILDKVKSNIEEIKARQGRIIAVTTEGCNELDGLYEWKIEIPQIPEPLAPILTVIPLQLLAYHVARLRGCDVDKPRNLAKSVTVE